MKTVIILTQPRSGSSLLAGILDKLGVYMGPQEDLKMSQHKNKYGSYENQAFLKLNHNILFRAKRLMLYWKRFNDDDGKVEESVKYFEPELKQLIQESEREFWGFKEAVIIYTLPYFDHLLANPHYVVLHRDSESVANSQRKAGNLGNWWPEIKTEFSYFTPWQRFVLFLRTMRTTFTRGFLYRSKKFIKKLTDDGHQRIAKFVIDKPHIFIELKDIIEKPQETVEEIISFLDLNPTEEQRRAALNFIHPELITSQVGDPIKKSNKNKMSKTSVG